MRFAPEFRVLVLDIGEDLVEIIRVKRVDIILRLCDVGILFCVDDQHFFSL